METIVLYTIVSVLIISLISFIGVFTLSIKTKQLHKMLILLVSFAAGALFGDAFIHLLPEAVEEYGFSLELSLSILAGIVVFFVVEQIIQWRHCHHGEHIHKKHIHPFAFMNLIGDAVHNFIDGVIIGASYLISIPAGIATTIAVALHEIPQEIGDFGVLLKGGFSRKKALFVNFLVSLAAVGGALVALFLGSMIDNFTMFLIPFAVGGFIYIAGADLVPEIHKEMKAKTALTSLIFFLLGIAVMLALLIFLE